MGKKGKQRERNKSERAKRRQKSGFIGLLFHPFCRDERRKRISASSSVIGEEETNGGRKEKREDEDDDRNRH